ncbi:sugar ABC transporter ATP-binding protein [Bosea thiooxidans]|uniref:Multiple sugar transport system ATP-binding protein n=1 Tax=Bosea thiooxidans TaxID=53254 RepID=A0A0Q3M5F7_9HYPH|nr:sn-glycerol-3-phosphate ABC transporter ATP-binding protein UgpC [Bosea thiooxidans]KQK30985.1 sugar ABC transporter ATP-binding protein [Bosea thiooxidans]SKB95132.1 multiple sugar transport system ATP-binding protein [Bosea thiooxidans]
MAAIELQGLVKRYGKTQVVHGIDLTIEDGEFVVFVGPSGCGKSTTLRMIAGLEEIDGGTISIGGRAVNRLEPKERNIAMVFQNYAIYPHMSVAENIGFGLYTAKLDKAEKRRRVEETGRILGLEALLERKPSALSGGQRQRVAIGRAMVRDPAAFLFDEPLSNLDAQLRAQMRLEIKRLHQRLGRTIVFVTHDQVEAMTLADRIVVMRDGRILQVGAPMELYEKPADVFTARFIGSPTMNILPARATTAAGATTLALGEQPLALPTAMGTVPADLLVGVRPQQLRVLANGEASDLVLSGKAAVIEPLGSETFVHVEHGGGLILASAPAKAPPAVGEIVRLGAPASALTLFDAASERAL